MLNITDKAISKWERDLACPDVATIPKLAQILGVSVEELLDAKAYSTYNADQNLAYEDSIEETETDYEDQEYREYRVDGKSPVRYLADGILLVWVESLCCF